MLNSSRIASQAAGACALALALLSSPAHAAPVLELSTANSAAGIDLTVSVRDVVDLYSYQFTLNFNPAFMTALGTTEGAFLPSAGTTFFLPGDIDNTTGSIAFVLGSLIGPIDGVDGSGDLATFSFEVEDGWLGDFSFSDVLFLDSMGNDIPVLAEVPEPASLWLAGVGLFALLGGRAIKSRAR